MIKPSMNQVYLITGGNTGNRKKNINKAAVEIENKIGTILQKSSIYETESWGISGQPAFYNQVLKVGTALSAKEIMKIILQIEQQMGRVRTFKNASRTIDIDILFFNDEIINTPDVVVPHKEIANRRFVLMPLNELSPEMKHPILKQTIKKLLDKCADMLEVLPLEPLDGQNSD